MPKRGIRVKEDLAKYYERCGGPRVSPIENRVHSFGHRL
jgi:hypothetical protein